MEKIKEVCNRLLEIRKQMSVLEAEKKAISPGIIEMLESAGSTKLEGKAGIITLSERISFTYSEKVDDKNKELKVLKTSEEESGVAKMKTTKYLRAIPTKE